MFDWRLTPGKASSLAGMRSKGKIGDVVSAVVCPSDPLLPQLKVLCLFQILVNSYGCACLSWTVVS